MSKRLLVTAALPYANGPLHVGHIAGAYLPADIYTRYKRLCGLNVAFICGTDEHGTPITVSADKEGVSPQEIVDKYHLTQKRAFDDLLIEFDNFSATSRKIHHETAQKFFEKILEGGYIYSKTVERPYCPDCKRFLPDRYVRGVCPKCETPDERGDQCEACGIQLEPHELDSPYCIICGGTPVMRETKHWFFRLSEFNEKLRNWIQANAHWPANARNFSLGWIKEGLEDRAITRDLSWGVEVPIEEAKGKVMYVWFDAPIGYISSTKEWADKKGVDWRPYWVDADIIHFIGKDNIPFHAVIWPAMLMAEGQYKLPWQIASNEYLNLEGRKMSTSRGWVLWVHELLEEYPADVIRYYLTSITPQSSDSDFSLSDFRLRVNNELIAALGNFVNRTLTFISNKKDGVVPHPGELGGQEKELFKEIDKTLDDIGIFIDNLNFVSAQNKMMSLAHMGNKYFQSKKPWEGDNETTLYVCANLLASISVAAEPFLPQSSIRIRQMLGLKETLEWGDAKRRLVPGGQRISEPSILFKQIEEKQMQQFKSKYLPVDEDKKVDDVSEKISFQQFQETQLRVATIKNVEDHPNADKLYVLTVDLGGQQRTLVAGIKDGYSKKELEETQVVVVANLEPVKIRGVESQGMLLASEDEQGRPVLVKPERKVSAGSKIR